MITRFRNYLFLSGCLVGLFSCEGDIQMTYYYSGLEALHAQNTGEKPELTSLDSIPKEAYVLRLNLFPVESERDGRYLDPETPPKNSNQVTEIIITSDKDFDSTLIAGSNLNHAFLVYNGNYLATSFLEEINYHSVYTDDFYDDPVPDYVDLLLMIRPDSVQYYRFFVEMTLKDGTVYRDSTSFIKLY
jgi:hypothetical protein